MVRRLLEALGVDYSQFRALVRTGIMLDFRVSAVGSTFQQRTTSGYGPLLGMLLFALAIGFFFAMLVWRSGDVFLSGTAFLTCVMFMVGAAVLIDFQAVVISPDDHAMLAYQPVSSGTYLAARLTNVLCYTSLIATALGCLPIGAYFFLRGFHPLLGLAALAATYLSSTGTTLAMILLYAAILRWVHPNKLRRTLTYLQLTLSFLLYGWFIIFPEMVNRKVLAAATLAKTPWILLHPATWFASYLDLALGRWGAAEIIPAGLSVAAIAGLVFFAAGRLSLDYSERLSALTSLSEDGKKPSPRAHRLKLFFRRDEPRAVALLVRNQFKYDQKFRLTVLGILPLTVLYLYLGLRDGPIPDPFVIAESHYTASLPLYLAVLLFPIILKGSLAGSDSYRASWVFFGTPADRIRLVLSVKNFVMTYFVAPYLVFLGVIFLYYFRDVIHVLLHLVVLALISHLFLQAAFFSSPELPFSRPVRKGERSAGFILLVAVGSLVALFLLPMLFAKVYPDGRLFTLVLAGLAASSYFLERAVAARIGRLAGRLQYAD